MVRKKGSRKIRRAFNSRRTKSPTPIATCARVQKLWQNGGMTARTTTATRNYDLTKVIKNEHAGKWIALSPNRTKVVAWANELSELEKLVGNRRVIYKKALRNDVSYAFKKTNF